MSRLSFCGLFPCFYPWLVQWVLTSLLHTMLKSISIWRTMMMQTSAHMALLYHSSLSQWPLANRYLPWLLFHVPSLMPQGLGTSSLTCFLPIFTHLVHKSSIVVLLRQQPHFLLCKLMCWEPTTCCSLSPFYSAEDRPTCSLVLLGAFCLHSTGIPCFLRWSFLSLTPSLSWGGPYSTQVSNSTLCS